MHANPEADRLIRESAKLSAAGAPDAQEPLEQAVALAPEDPNILVRAAGLSFDNGRFDRARELLDQAVPHTYPDFVGLGLIAYLGGLLLVRDGNREPGLKLLQMAFDREPFQRDFGYRLAIQLLRAGRTADARSVAAKAIEAAAEEDDLPRLREQLEKIAVAEGAHADGPNADTAFAFADALEVFDRARARELFESVLQTGDERQRAHAAFNLGSLVRQRDRAASQRYYEQALAGEDPLIRSAAAFNLGGLLRVSDPMQARSLFGRASESPDPGLAQLAREQLAALD